MAFPVFPYRPQAGDLTPEQIAQLQAGGDPYADGWAPFAPRSAALDTIGQGLTGLGAGLLSGRNWGEGLSRGLLAANQGMQQAGQDARRDYYVDQQGRYMQRKIQQEDRQVAREDEATRREAAAIANLSANPPAGVDPQQWASAVAADPKGMAGAWGKSLFPEQAKPSVQHIRQGDQDVTVMVDGQGKIISELGRGRAFAPVQGPAPDRELVIVQGPNGPMYVPRSQAAGMPVPGKPENVEYVNVMDDKGRVQAYVKGSKEAATAIGTPGARVVSATLQGNNVTEQQRRAQMQYTVVQPEAATLAKTWPALSKPGQQIIGMGGKTTNFAQSADYQRARQAVKTIVASWLYVSSGATANPGEVETQTDALMPQFGEDPATVADKQRRIQTYVESINQMAAAAAGQGAPAAPGAPPPPADTGGTAGGNIPPPPPGFTVRQ